MTSPAEFKNPEKQNWAKRIFDQQNRSRRTQPYIHYEERMCLLKRMEQILSDNDQEICAAICTDFGNRSHHETKLLEIATCITGIRHTRKKLKKWMTVQKRKTSLLFFGGKNRVIPQAKGVVGIIAPWNYPLFLSIGPLACAIAAGNRAMVKQAADSQSLCRLLQQKFSKKIPEDLIAFLPGVQPEDFSSLGFHHLIFTGSPMVGKTIMRTAADHLTPVTLELGGKSPTVVAPDFDLKTAAERVLYAKLINSGQTCVAPDYIFVPKDRIDRFISLAKSIVLKWYPNIESLDYTSIINQGAYSRLMAVLEDAKEKNADVVNLLPGPPANEGLCKISPTIVTSVHQGMKLMQEEIFGPLLPIMTYETLDEVIDYINRNKNPLALYVFSKNKNFLDRLINNTLSGGVTVNDCAMHAAQHDLPFGGIGNSGMGHYHGYDGFAEFSKMKPVFTQSGKPIPITPPYGKFFNRIYGVIKKWKWLA